MIGFLHTLHFPGKGLVKSYPPKHACQPGNKLVYLIQVLWGGGCLSPPLLQVLRKQGTAWGYQTLPVCIFYGCNTAQ